MTRNLRLDDGLMAAVDLGSNSFHIAIARLDHGVIRITESLSEKVQLAAGLDQDDHLDEAAQERGLACLSRFGQQLAGVEPRRMRIVATNALRVARNAREFVQRAETVLNHPVEIIAGREEARLIYVGVSQTLAGQGRRLVIDIGGGSTEFIIGDRHEPLLTESLHMGCVSYTQRFFADGQISAKALDKAVTAARQELSAIAGAYLAEGWQTAIGSSGTIKAVRTVIQQLGWSDADGIITAEHIERLRELLLQHRHVSELDLPGLKEDRRAIMPAGFAIISAIFQSLGLDTLGYSDGALREGVLHDLLGRFQDVDIRDRTVTSLQQRYSIDPAFAARVADTALDLLRQSRPAADIRPEDATLLERAAQLHEIGQAISHSGYHKHGAYLLLHSDLAGFSRPDQERLSLLVGLHRRRMRQEQVQALLQAGGPALFHLCLLLRLAVLLHHSRSRDDLPAPKLKVDGDSFTLRFPRGWLNTRPLTCADLEQEQDYFAGLGLTLDFA
ncbi:exopolyphosphatase [Amnimonas aquatica]|uniref:Exopolyphosphatase n=1 Tax=Amnimonas aquatica TaxID=2094561 RepID=A0A2P6AUF0_9GAMM|nr:exopolyphosphatase [Amnimonas aquatica]PQA49977.1 exopolyphosphatase [Amnimonas aquatica]